MKILIQRVQHASVTVNGDCISAINKGILALIGIEASDTEATLTKGLHKLMHYRIFSDENEKMNLNLQQTQGELLLVSQFTLVADTQKGLRPSFSKGASPEQGKQLFEQLVMLAQTDYPQIPTKTGQFGADMKVELLNDGPVTFLLDIQ